MPAPVERRASRRRPISGSNSSATACSAWSIADMLIERFPEAPEGELSRRLARLVSRDTCAEVARRAWRSASYLRIGGRRAEGRRPRATPGVLADVCEAVIAAVYRDGGLARGARADRALLGAAHRRDERAAPRRQDGAAGMGAPARLRRAGLCRDAALRARPRAGIRDRGHGRRRRAGARQGRLQARGRARGGGRACCAARACGARHDATSTPTRAGFVALIGAPNAGKSTLLNARRRREGLDRHPQGADDAGAGPRHRRSTSERADRLRRHAGHLRAEAAAGARHGDDRLGRRGRRRRGRAPGRRQARADRRGPRDPGEARGLPGGARARADPEQGRHREARHAAGADQGGERGGTILAHLHGLGADRRRASPTCSTISPRRCRKGRSSIRRTR